MSSFRQRLPLLGALFVATGLTGLVVEQIFEKLLATVIGASTPAATIVLAVYFLGLSVGSAGYGLVARGVRRPVRLYAAAEAFVGLWALGLAVARAPLVELSSAAIHLAGDAPGPLLAMRMAVAAVWILPPTVAMGLSFPAVVGALRQLGALSVGRMTARFYALNLLGAVAGALAGPYLLFPTLGLTGTLVAVVGVQAVVVVAIAGLGRGLPEVRGDEIASGADPVRLGYARLVSRPGAATLMMLAGLSGFLFFGLEVLWAHLVGAVVGTSVYAFANMLAMALAGLFAAGLSVSFLFRGRDAAPAWALPLGLASAATVLAWTGRYWDDVGDLFVAAAPAIDGFAAGELMRLSVAALLVGVPAAAMGTVYPLLFRDPRFPRDSAADGTAGLLAGANAVGSIGGALATGFLLLPALGSEGLYRVFVAVLALVAAVLALAALRRADRGGRRALAAVAAVAVVAPLLVGSGDGWRPLGLTSGANVYFRPGYAQGGARLLFWHEDLFGGFTTVIERRESEVPFRTLLTNGKFQGNDSGEMVAQIGLALVPLVHQPRRERALVVGLGTGHTAAVVAAAGFEAVEVAEIAPGIVEAAGQFFSHVNQGLLERPEVELQLEDGRNLLLRSDRRYDLVVMELTSVWFAGASSLYSREFYELVSDRLAPGGVMQQWIQLHHIDPREVASAVATVATVFEHAAVWRFGGQGILLGSNAPLELRPASVAALRAVPRLAEHLRILETFGGPPVETMGRYRLLDADGCRRLAAWAAAEGIPLNTDGNRYLEYATPRHNLERREHEREVLAMLARFR